MNDATRNRIIEEVAGSIDIPETAYEKAEARYKDLSEWFGRKEASCYAFNPHIYSQGSFRLGTVIRPVDDDGDTTWTWAVVSEWAWQRLLTPSNNSRNSSEQI